MPNYDGWVADGTAVKTQDDTVWIQPYGTYIPFAWLGTCARLDEGTESLGDVSVTHKRNPRGGLSRHSVLKGAPGETTDTLTIKRLQYDRKRSDLISCWWNIDQRLMCGGINADAWNEWTEIIRRCYGSATERGIPATAFDGDNEEQMFSFGWTSLWLEDLYRITGEIGAVDGTGAAIAEQVTDITSCQPSRCPDGCDDQQDCIVVAITEDDLAVPYMIVNLHGGDLDQWGTPIALTDFGANDATQVACAGAFVVITCVGDTSIIRTDDLGVTQVKVETAAMTLHAPTSVDMIDQSFVVVGGADGYIYGSWDAARTWETLDAGNATTNPITRIMIARDDPMTIYGVCAAADVVVKTVNGGKTWFTTTATGMAGTGPTALWVTSRNHVLVGSDAGEIWETNDGGTTWTEQADLDGIGTKANVTIADMAGCGCGVVGLITENSADNARYFYRNVDNGSSGRWFQPAEYEAIAAAKIVTGLTCCSPNHFIAVGGAVGVDNFALLLE